MRIRIKFSKLDEMRFVGHLDLMRYFQRALRRAGIDMTYSQGFHPHPLMSFAAPLALGITSDGEYMDIEVNTTASPQESIAVINSVMADGIKVAEYIPLEEGKKAAMSVVAAADYIVCFRQDEDMSQPEISDEIRRYYTERDEIEVTKQSKKGVRIFDLKPLLYRFEPYSYNQDNSVTGRGFFLRVSAGSRDNIRPEFVLEDFYSFCGRDFHPENLQIHRLELYAESACGFVPLSQA